MKNLTSKVLAATLLTVAVASQSAMASSEGPSGFEQVLPGNNTASLVFDNHAILAATSASQGASGYEGVLPGYQEQVTSASLNVSYMSQEIASDIIEAYDTTR